MIETTRRLWRAPIDPAAAQAAVESVRRRFTRRGHRKLVLLSSGIAAAAAIVLVALVLSRPTAAQQLQRAAEKTRDYKGWVHIHRQSPMTQPATTQPTIRDVHFNTIDGTYVMEMEANGRRQIQMKIPSKKLWYIYDPHSNELRIAGVSDVVASSFAENVDAMPLSIAEILKMFTAHDGKAPHTTQARDGGLVRFEIALDAARKLAVWVDPKTNLIQRMGAWDGKDGSTSYYSYGKPEFGDIYDYGVPRDAIVIDGRPPADAEAVVARLHGRAVTSYGDGVAIVTQESVHNGVPQLAAEVRLIARDGNKLVHLRYFSEEPLTERWLIKRPAHWPTPGFDDVLAVIRDAWPAEMHVVNGADAWQAGMVGRGFQLKGREGVPEQNLYIYGVGAMVWPTREYLGLNMPGTKARIITDPARRGLIGVEAGIGADDTPGRSFRIPAQRRTYWIDPKRDDMPIEILDGEPAANGELRNYMHTSFTQHAQLPDGRWYPTTWQIDWMSDGVKDVNVSTRIVHMQVLPGAKIDASWYDDPAKRFGGQN